MRGYAPGYNIDIATKYGFVCAVLLQHIHYWVEHNKANNKNLKDGKYWTYNSVKAFKQIFPYFTNYQISKALDLLVTEQIILRYSFGEGCDRTLWYTTTPKALNYLLGIQIDDNCDQSNENNDSKMLSDELKEEKPSNISNENQNNSTEKTVESVSHGEKAFCEIDKSIIRNQQMDSSNSTNDNYPIINTNININIKEKTHKKESEQDFVCEIINHWNNSDLIKCEIVDKSIVNAINNALKSFTLAQILECITRYKTQLRDKYYFATHEWSLKSFLNNKNALPDFMDNGEKWINYLAWKNSSPKSNPDESDYRKEKYRQENKDLFEDLNHSNFNFECT